MSRISKDIFTTLDLNGPYLRIDTQPTSTTANHNEDAVFTIGVSTYYLVGDEADTTGTEDAVPPTVDDDGTITYQWYEINQNDNPGNVTKLTNTSLYTGTTTNTLTVKNVLSPGSHLNQYYCIVAYDPSSNTGDAINESLTSDTVTLNVRPYLIIDTQPVSIVTGFNPSSGTLSTKAILSDTRTPWQNYRLEYQWWEKNQENVSAIPNTRLTDGDFQVVLSTSKTVETVINETQFTTLTESVSAGNSKRVGIPTEVTEVTFTVSGGIGGNGGNENSSNLGGVGGAGRSGEFKFSDLEINSIRNAGAPVEYILSSGSRGNDGVTQISAPGGLGGFSFDENATPDFFENDSVFGGKGGSSGPGGVSGSGGGGGGGSALLSTSDSTSSISNSEWMVIAGGGGGGAGSSSGAPGVDGQDAGDWREFDTLETSIADELKPATVVNFNPKAGTTGNQDPIEYGFYIKSTSPISSVNDTTDYRIIVIWDNEVVVDTTSKLTKESDFAYIDSLISNEFYVISGNVKYYASTHKGSELGWCDDESNLSTVCVRGDGGYVNSFDVIRYGVEFVNSGLNPLDGGDGASKITGDGGGGGGAGGGANVPAAGGTAGANPVATTEVDVIFKITGKNNTGSNYIKFVENSWYGFPETEPNRGQTITFTENDTTQTVTLKAGVTYDVVSSFEDGDRTSDSLRILQDFTPDANQSDIIAGRSIGMNASGVGDNIQTGNEDDFRDLIVSVSDGTFGLVPQTVRLDDGEILGKSIIRYTAPIGFRNQTAATGGQGGQSQYNTARLTKVSGSKNVSIGAVDMTIKTEQPFNELNQDIVDSIVRRNISVRGAHPYTSTLYKEIGYTSELKISSDYVFSKKILCQITVKDTGLSPIVDAQTSFSNSLYTDTVDFTVVDDRDDTITIERIRHNDDFAIVSSLNLNNGDITFEKSGSTDIKEVEYYSFYSTSDIEVDIQMYGGKGNDVNGNTGGEGGFSYLRLNMEKNTEYVIAGLNDYVNTPFLFKKGRLLACVGAGGGANTSGPGAPGGGVSVSGGNAYAGGVGGSAPTTLEGDGIHGSASSLLPIAPDTKASTPNGGTTIRCSKGNLFQSANQPNPCSDRGSSVKFALSDGTLVTNTKEINRGFKAGYNIFYTGGLGSSSGGNGGSGATGGQGNVQYGGGGGSGYIAPDEDLGILVRSEGNSERVASLTTQSGLQGSGGNPISSTLGGSTGPARVVLSLAEIPTKNLDEFIERPAAPTLTVSEEDVQREPEFTPLPEIAAPPPVDPPNPNLIITSAVSRGFASGDKEYTSFRRKSNQPSIVIGVLETGSIDFFTKSISIPANTRFYWRVEKITDFEENAEFEETTGSFTTSQVNGEVVGQFTVTPKSDNETNWTTGNHSWRIKIYTDANYIYEVNQLGFDATFRILDNSLSSPTATITSLIADTTTGIKIYNNVDEGKTLSVDVETFNIHNGQSIGWEIVNISTNNSDFVTTSGTAIVSSGYSIDSDGVPTELNSDKNRGIATFNIEIDDDVTTEGSETFALRLKYPTTSSTYFVDTRNAVGEVKKTIRINDTSQDPEADISGAATIDEDIQTTYTLSTQNFRNNEVIYWRIVDSGNNVATNDFVNATGTAAVTVTGTNQSGNRVGTATITVTATADATTEGPETFTLQLYRNSSYSIVVNTTPGTGTPSTKSITVNDTSLTPVQYGGFITASFASTPISPAEVGEGTELRFIPQAWNLTSEEEGHDVYWVIVRADVIQEGVAAIAGTEDVTDDLDKIPDFNIILGQTKFKRIGYVNAVGSTLYKTSIDPANGYIIPYHIHKDSQTFTAINNFFSHGYNRKFKIAYYKLSNDRTYRKNTLFTTPEMRILDTSRTKIAFNGNIGFGVEASKSRIGRLLTRDNLGQSLTSPSIDEGKMYFFRVETSAPPGTQLYYRVEGLSADDFELVDDSDIALSIDLVDNVSYPRGITVSDEISGYLTTYDRDGYTSQIDGADCVRSISYIYLKTKADVTSEGEESFNLAVYDNSSYESLNRAYVRQTVKINDTSAIPPPTISVSITPSSVTIGPDSGKDVTLSWTVGGGQATSGNTSGSGFNSGYYDSTNTLDAPTGSSITQNGSETGKLKPVNYDAATQTLKYTVEVSNASGTASDTANLTIYSEPAPPPEPRKYERYRSVKIFRYYRQSNSGRSRWSHTTYGPGGIESPSSVPNNDWGQALYNLIGSENNNVWQLQGPFGNIFTRQPPGANSIVSSTRGLDGYYFPVTENAFAFLNVSNPTYAPDSSSFFGMVPTWGNTSLYGLANSDGNPSSPSGEPVAAEGDWEFGAVVGSETYDKWRFAGEGFHYWDVTDGISVYVGQDEPDGDIEVFE